MLSSHYTSGISLIWSFETKHLHFVSLMELHNWNLKFSHQEEYHLLRLGNKFKYWCGDTPKESTFEVKSKQGLWAQIIDMQILNCEITFICQNKNPPGTSSGLSHERGGMNSVFQDWQCFLVSFQTTLVTPGVTHIPC